MAHYSAYAVDATDRPQKMPPRFLPYLEKHCIYELFHELSTELVINQPTDHISFLKQALEYANMTKDSPRVIILAPPYFDKFQLAQKIAKMINIIAICLLDLERVDPKKSSGLYKNPNVLAKYAVKVLKSEPVRSRGWILVDFPRDRSEALVLQQAGILPTHVLQLVPSVTSEETCLNSKSTLFTNSTAQEYRTYRQCLYGLRLAYKSVLKECEIRGQTMQNLAEYCVCLIRKMRHRGAPILPRVVILGPVGSGRKTQARLLQNRFGVIHVDINHELQKTCMSDSEVSHQVRYLNSCGLPVFTNTKATVLEHRLMKSDCLINGWVLTGYPTNLKEMHYLDQMDTPPNRIILLNVPFEECKSRVVLQVNKNTGSHHHLGKKPPMGKSKKQIEIHPDASSLLRVQEEIELFRKYVSAIILYCGKTAVCVDGCQDVQTVHELISATIVQPTPIAPVRRPPLKPETPVYT